MMYCPRDTQWMSIMNAILLRYRDVVCVKGDSLGEDWAIKGYQNVWGATWEVMW